MSADYTPRPCNYGVSLVSAALAHATLLQVYITVFEHDCCPVVVLPLTNLDVPYIRTMECMSAFKALTEIKKRWSLPRNWCDSIRTPRLQRAQRVRAFLVWPLGGGIAGFRVSEIKADGHCLYRAVAEQLSLTGRRPGLTEESYPIMREEAARCRWLWW